MGARGKKHAAQRRRNTSRTNRDWMAGGIARANERIRRQDDEETFGYIDSVLRSTEAGYIKRKYNS